MNKKRITFENIPLNKLFSFNGANYKKQSTRTAYLIENNRIFYFSKNDLCIVPMSKPNV